MSSDYNTEARLRCIGIWSFSSSGVYLRQTTDQRLKTNDLFTVCSLRSLVFSLAKGITNMRNDLKLFLIMGLCVLTMGMSRRGQYDEEARDVEKFQKNYDQGGYSATQSAKDMASGVKQATYDSTKDLLTSTAEGTSENPPVVGTVKGVMDGSGKVLEQTSKGIAKVATFGRADTSTFRVEDPEHGKENDTTKVKFNF